MLGALIREARPMDARHAAPPHALNARAVLIAAALGMAFWLPAVMLVRVAVAIVAAVTLDILAMSLAPTLYAPTPGGVLAGAILIPWGVGLALILALLADRRTP